MVSKKSLDSPTIGILTGSTASGKTDLALGLAAETGNIEIINADSLLIFREMNIGTAKPTSEELGKIPHHLIDIRNPDESFTAGDFLRAANAAIENIHQRGKRALIVGGTGFYLKALLFGIWKAPSADSDLREKLKKLSNDELYDRLEKVDSQAAQRIGKSDTYRLIRSLELVELSGKTPTELEASHSKVPDPRFRLWIIQRSNDELSQRIAQRTEQMLAQDLVGEYQRVYAKYPSSRALASVGYLQVGDYLEGKIPSGRKIKPGTAGLSEEIQLATRQLVKRQKTWFRGQCRFENCEWFELDGDRKKLEDAWKSVYGTSTKEFPK